MVGLLWVSGVGWVGWEFGMMATSNVEMCLHVLSRVSTMALFILCVGIWLAKSRTKGVDNRQRFNGMLERNGRMRERKLLSSDKGC